jgi:hypothetical protein
MVLVHIFSIFTKKSMILIAISLYMVIAAVGIIIFSIRRFVIVSERSIRKEDVIQTRKENKLLFVFFENFTAISLIAGSISILNQWKHGPYLSLFALVAMVYISLKKFQWGGSENEDTYKGIFAGIGFIGAALSISAILLNY